MENSIEKRVLYVVATPIGNLKDVTYRAVEVLSQVDCIAAGTRATVPDYYHNIKSRRRVLRYTSTMNAKSLTVL